MSVRLCFVYIHSLHRFICRSVFLHLKLCNANKRLCVRWSQIHAHPCRQSKMDWIILALAFCCSNWIYLFSFSGWQKTNIFFLHLMLRLLIWFVVICVFSLLKKLYLEEASKIYNTMDFHHTISFMWLSSRLARNSTTIWSLSHTQINHEKSIRFPLTLNAILYKQLRHFFFFKISPHNTNTLKLERIRSISNTEHSHSNEDEWAWARQHILLMFTFLPISQRIYLSRAH